MSCCVRGAEMAVSLSARGHCSHAELDMFPRTNAFVLADPFLCNRIIPARVGFMYMFRLIN